VVASYGNWGRGFRGEPFQNGWREEQEVMDLVDLLAGLFALVMYGIFMWDWDEKFKVLWRRLIPARGKK